MSVRATGRIIGELVNVPSLPGSPQMVVKAYDDENNLITTVWFSGNGEYQEGVFPCSALDRTEQKILVKARAKTSGARKAVKRMNRKKGKR